MATNLTGLKSSSDGGITWNTIAFSGISVKSLAIEDTLIFVSLGTQIHRSFDDGITWQIVRNGINNSLSDNLLILGTNIFMVLVQEYLVAQIQVQRGHKETMV